jgi:NAD(P)-dependent dehydrogenase (short-subunit alcohol dehydrogenase family)
VSQTGTNPPSPHNKVALVAGAAGAIGYGVCKALLANGYRVAASDLPGEKLDGFVRDVAGTATDRVVGVALDVTNRDSVREGFRKVAQNRGARRQRHAFFPHSPDPYDRRHYPRRRRPARCHTQVISTTLRADSGNGLQDFGLCCVGLHGAGGL